MVSIYLVTAMHVVSVDGGRLHFAIPANVEIRQKKLNFETSEYDIWQRGQRAILVTIVDGGGAYDTTKYRKICLNGREAWQLIQPNSMDVIVGEPGFYTVDASYSGLNAEQTATARRIIRSIRFDVGMKCEP